MPEPSRSYQMFHPKRVQAFIADLGLEEGSVEALTIESLFDAMATQMRNMEGCAYWIHSKMDEVDKTFTNAIKYAEQSGSVQSVSISSLGALQSQAPQYDISAATYAALQSQLTLMASRIRERNNKAREAVRTRNDQLAKTRKQAAR